jgi:CubicO group peptidase (beta-lactamase class C family)
MKRGGQGKPNFQNASPAATWAHCFPEARLYMSLIKARISSNIAINPKELEMIFKCAIAQTALFLALVSVPFIASAQSEKVDEYVRAEMQSSKIPGISLAVIKNGEIVKAKGYGLANVELGVPATPETVYQSGSVGKQFIATLVMMLVEEGKIGLDDPISKYFPDSPDIWKPITIRHLLTHTSGISNKFYEQINLRQDYTEDDLVKKIAASPLDFQPGQSWIYSNAGYVMLGILVHKATGRFYGDLMQEKIFSPLGMTTARIISEADIVMNRAAGYHLANGELKNQDWVSPTFNATADGSLYLSVLDMAKWDLALNGEKLLKRESLDQMWTPVKTSDGSVKPYGFGWAIVKANGHRLIEHGGAWQGFKTHIARYVDDRLSVIVLANLANADPGRIAHAVVGFYVPEVAPRPHKEAAIDKSLFSLYTGTYEIAPGITISITREADKLYARVASQQPAEIFAESETEFFEKAADIQFTFVKDAKGAVNGLVLHQNGDFEAKKMK